MRTLITIAEFKCCLFKLDDRQTNTVSLDRDESTINLQGGGVNFPYYGPCTWLGTQTEELLCSLNQVPFLE